MNTLFGIYFSQNYSLYILQAVHTMKVGASLNAKGWGMISEGLTMLETATAGADMPQLWSLLEAFFGKVDDNDASVASAPLATGHPTTFRAAKHKLAEGDVKASSYTEVIPGPSDEEPGMESISYYSTTVHLWLSISNYSGIVQTQSHLYSCLFFIFLTGIPKELMLIHSTNKDGKVVYPCKWRHCQEEHSSRVNTCTHM